VRNNWRRAELAAEAGAHKAAEGAWVCMVAWRLMYWINSQVIAGQKRKLNV
jgi:hypothetical protein